MYSAKSGPALEQGAFPRVEASLFLHRSDAEMYPQSAKLVSTIASCLHGMPDVEKFFFEACEADELNKATAADAKRAARAALQAGNRPFVDVHQGELKVPEGGKIVEACGFTDTFGKTPFIIITYVWFDAYEFGIDSEREKNATRLIRTLLHETVHWVRETIGADDQITVGGRFQGAYGGGRALFRIARLRNPQSVQRRRNPGRAHRDRPERGATTHAGLE